MSELTPFTFDDELGDTGVIQGMCENSKRPGSIVTGPVTKAVLLLSFILNILLAIGLVAVSLSLENTSYPYQANQSKSFPSPFDPEGIEEEVLMPVRYGWEYYADTVNGMNEVDRNWEALNPDLGFVSLSQDELSHWGFSAGGDDPSDPKRGLHALGGYHSIHCLKIIRHTMLQLARGEKLDVRFGHSMHCLGSLLRDVICTADNSLPLKVPDGEHGDYQYTRKCRNWAPLSRWAGTQTSCMATNSEGTLDADHPVLSNCSRTDGVIVPKLSIVRSNS
ncbi:hypothetical protein F4808DRAFT_465910 [Astrocystis sublimbata]|nr:hypothetical protein F4808DRAFT_465910 [Astrocystis sublimbata]